MVSFKKALASLGIAVALFGAQAAMADTVTITKATVFAILPSSDFLGLGASHFNTSIGATPSLIDLQFGNFFIQTSSIPDQTISYVIDQDITINGITRTVAFNFSTSIAADVDTVKLAPGALTQFGNVLFQSQGFSGRCDTLGDHFFMVQAQVSAVPEPETYAMMLAGLGLLGFAAKRRQV